MTGHGPTSRGLGRHGCPLYQLPRDGRERWKLITEPPAMKRPPEETHRFPRQPRSPPHCDMQLLQMSPPNSQSPPTQAKLTPEKRTRRDGVSIKAVPTHRQSHGSAGEKWKNRWQRPRTSGTGPNLCRGSAGGVVGDKI